MSYDARKIANWFISRSARDNKKVSIMTLLKLTYIAHGWHLEMFNRPLFPNRIEAWKYGPVIRDVYNDFRNQGVTVSSGIPNYDDDLDEGTKSFLEQIYTIYGSMNAYQLSDLTHVKGGPWQLATMMGGNHAPIPDDLIKQHYVLKRPVGG